MGRFGASNPHRVRQDLQSFVCLSLSHMVWLCIGSNIPVPTCARACSELCLTLGVCPDIAWHLSQVDSCAVYILNFVKYPSVPSDTLGEGHFVPHCARVDWHHVLPERRSTVLCTRTRIIVSFFAEVYSHPTCSWVFPSGLGNRHQEYSSNIPFLRPLQQDLPHKSLVRRQLP